jgi:hypothetical protein
MAAIWPAAPRTHTAGQWRHVAMPFLPAAGGIERRLRLYAQLAVLMRHRREVAAVAARQ